MGTLYTIIRKKSISFTIFVSRKDTQNKDFFGINKKPHAKSEPPINRWLAQHLKVAIST